MASVCTPVPSACYEDTLGQNFDATLGAGTSAVMEYVPKSALVGLKMVSSYDRLFRDPDVISVKEPETSVPLQAFAINVMQNIIKQLQEHGLRRGEWGYDIVVIGNATPITFKDLDTPLKKILGTEDIAAAKAVLVKAQQDLSKLMDEGLRIYVCPTSVVGAYTNGLITAKPYHEQLFDRRIQLISAGCSFTAQRQRDGFQFVPLF
jgi:hypothetical protein